MKKKGALFLLFVMIAVSAVFYFCGDVEADNSIDPIKTKNIDIHKPPVPGQAVKPVAGYGNVPLYFIPNRGQVNRQAVFYAKTPGYTLWMTKEGLVFDGVKPKGKEKKEFERDYSKLVFIDAHKKPGMAAADETAYKVNYFKGEDKSEWRTDIPTSKAVLYKELYKHIDLKVYGVEKQIEYDWIVKPGGKVGDILFEYQHAKKVNIDTGGDLVIRTKFGELRHKKPVSYQNIDGKRVEVAVTFRKVRENIYGFSAASYDRAYELVIDPLVLTYSTYLGGSSNDYAKGIVVDTNGCAIVVGTTSSIDFPIASAFQPVIGGSTHSDVFVTKFSTDGSSLIYSTFLGGPSGNHARDIAIDTNNCPYITGYTIGSFPTEKPYQFQAGGGCDVFITKLSESGNALIYSTYVGRSGNDQGNGIAVDNAGSAYVVGITSSTDFPLTASAYDNTYNGGTTDAFVLKMSANGGSLVYSTFIGGNNYDQPYSIAMDSTGNAYITGFTGSGDYPAVNAFQPTFSGGAYPDDPYDAFVTKLNSSGTGLVYSTYLGGGGDDKGFDIDVDNSGSAYITGYTTSGNFPLANAYQDWRSWGRFEMFVTKFSTDGASLVYSTYLGGTSAIENGDGIAVDDFNCAYVVGTTSAPDFPYFPLDDPFQRYNAGSYDTVLVKFSPSGQSLLLSTYFGGSGHDAFNNSPGWSITLDNNHGIYIAGVTQSVDFPTMNPFQANKIGTLEEGAVAKFYFPDPPPVLTVTSPNGGEIMYQGENHSITWTFTGISDTQFVNLVLLQDGSPVGAIAENIAITAGSYNWTVGLTDNGTAAPGNNYQIQIQTNDGSYTDTSDTGFSIGVPSITVVYPNGGENLVVGNRYYVTWVSVGPVGPVKMEYSYDNGASWSTIYASTANDGIHKWDILNTPSNQCILRISESGGGPSDESDALFNIIDIPETCGSTWTPVNAPGQHTAATYGNGAYVAAGNYGSILSSPDGVNWTARTSGTSAHFSGITYGNNLFAAVGQSGAILTSPDGSTWTARTSDTGSALRAVTYGNAKFIAVGYNGKVVTSPDGIQHWQYAVPGTTIGEKLQGVVYGASGFVVVGNNGTIITSPDGSAWTARTSPVTANLNCVTYGPGLYVAVGHGGGIVTSPDGVTWTSRASGTGNNLHAVIYSHAKYLAAGSGGDVLSSADGIDWTLENSGIANSVLSLAYGDGDAQFLAVGIDTAYVSLCDPGSISCAENWQWNTVTGVHTEVAFGNNIFVSVATGGVIHTSTDGINWTQQNSGATGNLLGVEYGNGLFAVVGSLGTILTSPNGVTWTARTSNITKTLTSVCYGDSRFVAVGNTGTVLTSDTGLTWNEVTGTGTVENLQGVTYGGTQYAAVGNNGVILTSGTGTAWTQRTSGLGVIIYSVTYGASTFVASARDGNLITSTDGITWAAVASGTTRHLYDVFYADSLFVAVGSSGTILTSSDASTWTQQTSNSGGWLTGITYGNSKWVSICADSMGFSSCN
jgi:hypothetical protein